MSARVIDQLEGFDILPCMFNVIYHILIVMDRKLNIVIIYIYIYIYIFFFFFFFLKII